MQGRQKSTHGFNVDISQKEHREENRDNVPTGEHKAGNATAGSACVERVSGECGSRESSVQHGFFANTVERAEREHCRSLNQADLKSIRRPDLHPVSPSKSPSTNVDLPLGRKQCLRESDVAIERERDGIHELGRVWHEREEGDSEELFRNSRPFEDDIDNVDKDFWGNSRDVSFVHLWTLRGERAYQQ